jgi:hypothetical protein
MVGIIGDRVGQVGERGEYWVGRNGSDLIWNSELQGGSPHLLSPIEQALECTNAYGTYGILEPSTSCVDELDDTLPRFMGV